MVAAVHTQAGKAPTLGCVGGLRLRMDWALFCGVQQVRGGCCAAVNVPGLLHEASLYQQSNVGTLHTCAVVHILSPSDSLDNMNVN